MRRKSQHGFSLLELLFASFLSVGVIATAVKAWTYLMYGYHKNSIQQELDIDVRMAMENFKQDLRLTSLDKVVFFPQGPGPYTALSFPKARDDNGDGLFDVDADGTLIWDETVIYHIYNGSPNQLRRTSFDPRNNTMTDAQRYQQLVDTVAAGTGPGSNSTTRPLFSNLFEWELEGKGAIFDAYNDTIDREEFIDLGSAMIEPGDHSITFRVLGKNPQSTDYNLGLDTLTVTSSRSTLQGEMRVVEAIGGGSYTVEYIEGGSWSDNNHLAFDAGSEGDLITLGFQNDCWEETVFTATGADADGTLVEFEQGISPSTYVVKLPGNDLNWNAADQTGDEYGTFDSSDIVAGQAIRVLVKGGNLGGPLSSDGGRPWYLLRASTKGPLHIEGVYLAESASDLSQASPNTVPGTEVQMRFGWSNGPSGKQIHSGNFEWVTPQNGVDLDIDMDKTYALTFLIKSEADQGHAPFYSNADSATVESYVIREAENPDLSDIADADWTAKNSVPDNRLFIVQNSWVQILSSGTYTSPIFDTHQENPFYDEIDWEQAGESGTISCKVRSSSEANMNGARDWMDVPSLSGPGPLNVPRNRYVQFQAHLDAGYNAWSTPMLKNVLITWDGVSKINDIALSYTTGPDMGIYEVEVDGNPLLKGLKARIEIYQDVPVFGGDAIRITAEITEEIEPRNSGW